MIDPNEPVGALQSIAIEPHGHTHHRIGDRGQHQRPTHGSADADIARFRGLAEHHGDEGHGAFRQGRAERSQHRAGRGRTELELVAHPFDTVDEVFAGQIDRAGRAEKQTQGKQHGIALGRASEMTVGTTTTPARQG